MAGLRNASRDSSDFALESERIWRDRELLYKARTRVLQRLREEFQGLLE
jgi:hypothetical protein